jgi:hypothetical protein
MRENVDDELTDVVVDNTARLNRGDNRREVIIGEDHGGRLASDIRARSAHHHADVGPSQRRGIVNAIAGHRDDMALAAQFLGDMQLRFR